MGEKKPIYKLFLMKPKEAWYRLTKEEQQALVKQDAEISQKMNPSAMAQNMCKKPEIMADISEIEKTSSRCAEKTACEVCFKN